jgi:hypothetical protein
MSYLLDFCTRTIQRVNSQSNKPPRLHHLSTDDGNSLCTVSNDVQKRQLEVAGPRELASEMLLEGFSRESNFKVSDIVNLERLRDHVIAPDMAETSFLSCLVLLEGLDMLCFGA